MLQKIEVDNFKSLSNFKLRLREGLNIFVGPNGSGKSNILNFFEFLSFLTDETVSNAVSYVGGAGSVFRRTSQENQFGEISFAFEGESQNPFIPGLGRKKRISYRYEAKIQLSEGKDRIYFSRQNLKLSIGNSKNSFTLLKNGKRKVDLEIDFKTDNDGLDFVLDVPTADKRKIGSNLIRAFGEGNADNILSSSKNFEVSSLTQTTIVMEFYRFIPEIQVIQADLNRGRVFNIDPQKTRRSDELTRPPGLTPDGGGLAATLYHLKDRNNNIRRPRVRPRSFVQFVSRPRAFQEIVEYIRAINPAISNISIESNSIENFVRILIEYQSKEGILRVPISLASDGTVKWIALVTAVLTNRSIFAIEEPENFLHPHMQTEIVRIMRESSHGNFHKKFVLMTTHSETLLNAVEPNEVIVVSMQDGRTTVKRSSRADELMGIIKETGFGIVHMYVTGMLD